MWMSYKNGICQVSFFVLVVLSVVSFLFSLLLMSFGMVYFLDWELTSLNSCCVVMTLLVDYKSMMFMSFVLYISSMVIYYSDSYMMGDMNINRFIILVLMFVLSMVFLIMSPNIISILLGWDGLGLVSYCLVIYYHNVKSYNAGMLTALSNRLGDVSLLIAIAWALNFGGWNYVYYEVFFGYWEMGLVGLLIVLAALTKSAQIPFSSWLPAAMAAPTPVSALVHSSTLVTAGVYLLIRFEILLSNSLLSLLLYVGCITMFMAGLGANFEFDLKKIIALSTLSQLGLMMSTIGLGYADLSYFHLLTHALFKALLFLCAGVIIHGMGNLQDIRGMGGMVNSMPCVSICFCVSNLALCGMPFLSGFYSKDLILEVSLMNDLNLMIFCLFFFSTGLTVCYTFRLIYYIMSGNMMLSGMSNMGGEDVGFLFPMIMLLLMAIFGGSMLSWLIILSPYLIYVPFWMKYLALIVSLLGGWIGYEMSSWYKYTNYSYKYQKVIEFGGSMWFMPFLSTNYISGGILSSGLMMCQSFDSGWNEELGSQGVFDFLVKMTKYNQGYQDNYFKTYLMGFFVWFFLIVIIYFIGLSGF
uniref:NADH dehydrogenase subunit 5 n=1 Tax=Vescelia pieli TaxID=2526987 RepID=UPI0030E08CA3